MKLGSYQKSDANFWLDNIHAGLRYLNGFALAIWKIPSPFFRVAQF